MPRGYKRPQVFDETKGTVRIWSREARVPGKVSDLIPGDVRREAKSHSDKIGLPAEGVPTVVDFYCTMRIPTTGDIRRAHLMGSEYGAIDIPAQHAWLRPRLAALVEAGCDVTLWLA